MTLEMAYMALASVGMIFFTMAVLYLMLVAPEKKIMRWAKKRDYVVLNWDDESITAGKFSRATLFYNRPGPNLYKVKIRKTDGSVHSVSLRIYRNYTEEFWENKTYDTIEF